MKTWIRTGLSSFLILLEIIMLLGIVPMVSVAPKTDVKVKDPKFSEAVAFESGLGQVGF